ncbi:hypothetical protein B7463_g6507, partial [Scytalidium lignicola]
MSRQNTFRSSKLRILFISVLKGERSIDSENAGLFLEAICDQDNKALCIQKIHGSEHGRTAFQSALSSNITIPFLRGPVTDVLRYLAAPELKTVCAGAVLQQLILKFVEGELLWDTFVEAFKSGELAGNGEVAFAWILLELISLPREKATAFVPVAQDSVIKRRLLKSRQQEVRLQGQRIVHIVDGLIMGHTNGLSSPGERHNNDFREISKIEIIPTAEELAMKDPYLPRADETKSFVLQSKTLAPHIDGQFRLLREDMVRDMREEIQIAQSIQKGRKKAFSVENLSVAGVHCDSRSLWSLQLLCTNNLPQMPQQSETARRQFLKERPKYLRHESLACLIADKDVVTLGSLVREEDLLTRLPPIKGAKNVKLVQLSTALFSYAPILKGLKEIKELPFEDEILLWNADSKVKPSECEFSSDIINLVNDLLRNHSRDIQNTLQLPNPTKLDRSQAACFISGIQRRVSSILGPPGTGKSFIGALLTKAYYSHSDEKILILTYKNHALDQFLEDIIKLGIPRSEIVRLGSKPAPSVRDLSMKDAASKVKLTREQCNILDLTKREAQDEGESLAMAFSSLEQAVPSKQDILEYLEFLTEGPPFFSAFKVPTRSDGTINVGKKGKAIGRFYLLDRWFRGKDAAPFKMEMTKYPEVWNTKTSDRLRLYREWKDDIVKERLDAVQSGGLRYNDYVEQIMSIYMERDLTVLRSKRIIACTTTAAAKYIQKLNSVRPGIVVVEEAGEILESHILTALGPHTKQLVLIGDHKQLRPKVNYALSVEKGDGYDLDRSLFERLVIQGYPYHTLHQQHRMRPELAEFIRQFTYPNLDNIIFLNHHHRDEGMQNIQDWKDNTSPTTKRNLFEVRMAMKCLRYLSQQDINMPTAKIVILVPYLGQLALLRDELSKDNDPVLNDLDSHDLVRAGLMPSAASQVNKPKVRISSIDNFQGDESEVVIVSLTRSNDRGDIGFLHSPERLNVLLSRARDGLILIGDAETFIASKKGGALWNRFIDMLKAQKRIYDGLPVKCEQHPARLAILRSPEDFDKECPDGGCNEPCGSFLKCGVHKCPRKCHYRSDHSRMNCEKVMETKCLNGHVQKRKCYQAQPRTCRVCEIQDRRDKKILDREMELQDNRLKAQVKHDMDIADLESQIQKIRDEATDKQTALERAQVLEQKKHDLATAQHQAALLSQQASQKTAKGTQASCILNSPAKTSEIKTSWQPDKQSQKPLAKPESTTPNKSLSESEWDRQKRVEGASNTAIDDLMKLVGLDAVKNKFLDIKAKIETVERQGIDMKKERMGMVMLGNPGTGKTTVARIYARFLASIGALPGKEFVEITGSGLANDGVPGAKKIIETLEKAGGGVFFIDEAYQLASGNNFGGKNVLDFILAEIENRRGSIAFILAGYNTEMEKFFEHNPGFDSRMPHRLNFTDYSDQELLTMFDSMIKRKYDGRARLEDGERGLYARILTKRLGRKRGTEGYGNSRDLENAWALVTERQASRLKKERAAGNKPDDLLFTKEDLIGPEPSGAIKQSSAWKKLQSLVGLQKVKDSVKALIDMIQRNYQRELKELEPIACTLHRIFLGSPGTGKTTVAKLYGSILADLGLLSKREVVIKNPSDFVGGALGQSEENTKNILKAAAGKVLVIDEAYGLDAGGRVGGDNPDPYKTAVIDTIVAKVQNTPGEDLCVLMLGYKEQMEDMMNHSNPGLVRRFRLSDAFYFDDFSDPDLMRVLDFKLKDQGLKATDEAKQVAIEVLARERDRPNFGNAGAVENLLSRAKELEQKRSSASGAGNSEPEITFLPQDFDEQYNRASGSEVSCRDIFVDIVGCEKLIDQLEKYQRIAKNMKALNKDPRSQISFNFIFKGPLGTGKTTVARKISLLYYQMGILSSADYVECSASDLIGQYVGHTGPKVQGKMVEALGRVLFVDEAYRFCDGGFGKEAVNELVDCLTKPKFMGKIVVILAGYTDDINELLRLNPGLPSRFPEEVIFENLDAEQCLELLEREIKKEEIDITPPIRYAPNNEYQQMLNLFAALSKLESWENGRDVKNIAKSICSEIFAKTVSLTLADRNESRKDSPPHPPPWPTMTQDSPNAPPNKAANDPEDTAESSPRRGPGVSDNVWQQLQEIIAKDRASSEAEQSFIAAQQRELQAQETARIAILEEMRRLTEEKRIAQEKRRQEIEEELYKEKQRIEAALRAKREAEEKLRKAKKEAEKKKEQERMIQKKIKDMGVCPLGYKWYKVEEGYCCEGGGHFLSNTQLGI